MCDPGMNQRQPFSVVASSRASHMPTSRCGEVYKNVESRWGETEKKRNIQSCATRKKSVQICWPFISKYYDEDNYNDSKEYSKFHALPWNASSTSGWYGVCVCVCVRACMRACVCAHAYVCVRACASMCVHLHANVCVANVGLARLASCELNCL